MKGCDSSFVVSDVFTPTEGLIVIVWIEKILHLWAFKRLVIHLEMLGV